MDEKIVTKAKLNLKEQSIELEGSEEFVKKYLEEFKSKLNEQKQIINNSPKEMQKQKSNIPSFQRANQNKKSVDIKEEPFDLNVKQDKIALKDYMSQKKPENNFEKTAVIGDYIITYISKNEFTEGQIMYAYKILGLPRSTAFHQMFLDIKKKNWIIEGSAPSKWKLTIAGEDFVKINLPKKVQNASINK